MRISQITKRAILLATTLTAASVFLTPATAQSTFDVTVLAGACANCHGTDGRSPGSIPSIAGRPESVLHDQLKTFRSDTPPANTTIMNRLLAGFNDDEIAALARHFSQIPPQQQTHK